jgi:hypothetical protein
MIFLSPSSSQFARHVQPPFPLSIARFFRFGRWYFTYEVTTLGDSKTRPYCENSKEIRGSELPWSLNMLWRSSVASANSSSLLERLRGFPHFSLPNCIPFLDVRLSGCAQYVSVQVTNDALSRIHMRTGQGERKDREPNFLFHVFHQFLACHCAPLTNGLAFRLAFYALFTYFDG